MLACQKPKIKLRSIKDISINIYRLIHSNQDDKLTRDMCLLIDQYFGSFSAEEQEEFFIEIIREVNAEWIKEQKVNASIVKIDSHVLIFLAHTVQRFNIVFLNKNKLSVLEFLLILSFNENDKYYNEAKRSLCFLNIELGYSLAGSTVFGFLHNSNNNTFEKFRQQLRIKYGEYHFDKFEF